MRSGAVANQSAYSRFAGSASVCPASLHTLVPEDQHRGLGHRAALALLGESERETRRRDAAKGALLGPCLELVSCPSTLSRTRPPARRGCAFRFARAARAAQSGQQFFGGASQFKVLDIVQPRQRRE